MSESILRLRVESQEYDNKLKRAAEGLNRYIEGCRKAGGTLEHVDDGVKEFTQELGKMGTVAGGAKGKLGEMTKAFTDLTMQFNQMTEAEKRGQFGKTLSAGLDELKQRIISTKQELADIDKSLNNVGGSGGGGLFGGDKLSGMLQVFGGNLMTKGAGMALSFAGELKDMVAQGIELAKAGEGVRLAFQRLGRGDLLDGLRQATHGTVTDLELMKAAVKFNDFKLPLDELGVMLAYAQQKAKDTGQSVSYLVDSIVNGLGRKSKLILDNLGISATELDEKMKETGDMTKAVGEIIREQMAKAGDYIETAADRATKANVELENAMTRLGETFQPLSDSATSMWTDIKVGALDLLNNAIRPLINAFTEAGRARALYEKQGGDVRVNRQLDRLKGIQTDSYRQGTYKAQLRNYDTQIASHEQYLKDYKAWQSDNTNVGAYDRMQKFKQQTGLEWVSDVQAHLDAFKKMRSEYVQGAKAILEDNPVPSPTSTTTITPTGGASGNTFDASKIAFTGGEGFKADPNANFLSVWGMMGGDEGLRQMMGIGKQQFDLGRDITEKDYKKLPGYKEDKETKKLTEEISTLTSGLSSIAGGLKSMGIDLPEEVDQVIGVIQGVTSVIEGVNAIISIFSTTTMSANTAALIANTTALYANAATNIIPFANGGVVGKAAGGMLIPGNSFSGDNLRMPVVGGGMIGVNSGEVVLNRAQTGNLASQLQDSMGAMQLSAIITGEQLRLVLNNNGRRTGRGEYVTTNFR